MNRKCPECDGEHDCSGAWRDCLEYWKKRCLKAAAENARLTEQLEAHAWEVSPAMAQAKIDQLQAKNARLAATIQAIADLSENSRAPAEAQIMKAIEYALGAVKNSTALADLLAPTIESLEAALVVGFDRAIVRKELARLRGVVERE